MAGAVICIVFAVTSFVSVDRQVADFQRVPVPGHAGVNFAQPGSYVIYIEEPGQCCSFNIASGGGFIPFPRWSMDVALVPVGGGPQVPLSTWRGAIESYGAAGHQGQTALYFTIGHPGRYVLGTRNAAPASITDLAVGRGIGRGVLAAVVLMIVGSLTLLAGLIVAVVTAVRRRGNRRQGKVPPFMPPMVDGGPQWSPPGEPAASGPMIPPRSYLQGGPVGFGAAISYGLRNWLVYRGRASRSAYWWFTLFLAIVIFAVELIAAVIATIAGNTWATAALIFVLVGIPTIYLSLGWLALTVRRLHDIGKSGWWVLIQLVPFAGPIILLVFTVSEGTPGPNSHDLLATDAGDARAARQPVPLADQQIIQDTLAGKRASGHRRGLLVMVGAGLVALAGVIAVGTLATSVRSSRPLASSAAPVRQLTVDQLDPGDCLRGSNMGLGTGSTWPTYVTAVPCTQRHIAEVFFASKAWPQSLAYPGDNTIGAQAYDRCSSALTAYVRSIKYLGTFSFDDIAPDRSTWPSGDRSVVCVAYRYDRQSVNYSISKRYR